MKITKEQLRKIIIEELEEVLNEEELDESFKNTLKGLGIGAMMAGPAIVDRAFDDPSPEPQAQMQQAEPDVDQAEAENLGRKAMNIKKAFEDKGYITRGEEAYNAIISAYRENESAGMTAAAAAADEVIRDYLMVLGDLN